MALPNDKIDPSNPQTAAQLEKLRLEVQELRWKVRWFYKLTQITSILLALVAVAAFGWNLIQFNKQQQANARAAADAQAREAAAIEREQKKPVRERQLALSLEISNVAAAIATLPREDPQRRSAVDRFRQLYYGPAIFIEDTVDMKKGMIEFANCLDGFDKCDSEEAQSYRLKILSKHLTNRCRGAIGLTWQLPQEDLYENDTQPLP
ncbi:MAG TPA: hypothetical protein VMZ30_11960 [Pyrinomonadaceae bacterium]|nr:hypothetical protein [Pyrinomonadaceae bacterium]